jgi:hypothetical protein
MLMSGKVGKLPAASGFWPAGRLEKKGDHLPGENTLLMHDDAMHFGKLSSLCPSKWLNASLANANNRKRIVEALPRLAPMKMLVAFCVMCPATPEYQLSLGRPS